MKYLEIIPDYPPYRAAEDKRGFISQYYVPNSHTGVDSVGNLWDMPVCAIFDGRIVSADYNSRTGNDVIYESGNGRVRVIYLHLRDKVTVTGNILKDQVLGYEGSTGSLATGKHLHTTMLIDGEMVDPLPYLTGRKEMPLEMPEPDAIQKGDKVVVVNPVTYYGQKFTIYYDEYDVLEVSGDRVVIGIGPVVTAAVNVKDIRKSDGLEPLKKGDKVKVIRPNLYGGGTFVLYYDEYDVLEAEGDRVVIGIGDVVTAAVNRKDLQKV